MERKQGEEYGRVRRIVDGMRLEMMRNGRAS